MRIEVVIFVMPAIFTWIERIVVYLHFLTTGTSQKGCNAFYVALHCDRNIILLIAFSSIVRFAKHLAI